MIPSEVYALACAIGKCGPNEEPDGECISIAWELTGYLQTSGFRIVKKEAAA